VAEEMRQRGVRVVDGFDADEAAFQAELVRQFLLWTRESVVERWRNRRFELLKRERSG
jgi:hypothetical protein